MKKPIIIALHVGYWFLYLLLLILFFLFLEAGGIKNISNEHERLLVFFRIMGAITILPGLISFYTFYNLLFKRYLSARKITALCIGGLITAIFAGFCGMIGLSVFTFGKISINNGAKEMIVILFFMSILALIHGVIALVMKGFITWYGDIQFKELLNKKNFETELALVKSQLNPHFLFNTINNIDVLIEKDATKASEYLNKLSDIMRFMLYETKVEKIPLDKELMYIGKYIDLQKIRTSNTNFVHYTVNGQTGNWSIAPMLFIPFIENAFKHSTNKKQGNVINIAITATQLNLIFSCQNNISEINNVMDEAGGLGNSLIAKRLNLLYPDKHELELKSQAGLHSVRLVIRA
jgi:sensor histidine kinase YesM